MTRPVPSLAVLGSLAIAAAVLVGTTASVLACPWSQSASAQSVTAPLRTGGSATKADLTTVVKPSQSAMDSLEMLRAGLYGLGALAGVAAIALVYRVRYSRRAAALADEIWLNHPELVHPELFLATIPKEALSSLIADRSIAQTR